MANAESAPSLEAIRVLGALKRHHNVLVSGPPGTGKSRLMNEVHRWFCASSQAGHQPEAEIPLPEGLTITPDEAADWLPSPERTNRDVFPTAFHPGSKYRDFLRGLVPRPGKSQGFVIHDGTLYRAAKLASTETGAALVIVDEINRGPAVQVFGDSIVALERDKRLDPDGEALMTTQYFEVLEDDGSMRLLALPYHLYILAAMNQADTSVEPLDVAFLRRFEPFPLKPDPVVLRAHFGLDDESPELPEEATAEAIYEASVQAWEKVNRRITLGRGPEFQIGHGVFMESGDVPTSDGEAEAAINYVRAPWRRIRAHVDEVFFGHARGVAAVLNVGANNHPLTLTDTYFAGDPVVTLSGEIQDLYAFLRAVAADEDAS